MMKKLLLTTVVLATVFPVSAEVYWPGPRRIRGASAGVVEGVLPGVEKILYSNKITVNDRPARLDVSAVKGRITDIIMDLKRIKVEKLNIAGSTIRFERRVGNTGMVERFLLIAVKKEGPVTCFRITVPEKLPPPGNWPAELPPLPPGAEAVSITRLENGAVCGEFRNASEQPYILLRRVDSLLRGRRMFAAGNEIASQEGGRGEIYFDKNSIIWVNFSSSGHGTYFRRLRGK